MSNNRNRSRPARTRVVPASGEVVDLDATDGQFTDREPLFRAGGVEYTTLVRVPAGAGLQYLELLSRQGYDGALIFALRYALGDDGYAALVGALRSGDDFAKVATVIVTKFTGAFAGPKAPQSNGSAPSGGS
jgi:hypothetical protein